MAPERGWSEGGAERKRRAVRGSGEMDQNEVK